MSFSNNSSWGSNCLARITIPLGIVETVNIIVMKTRVIIKLLSLMYFRLESEILLFFTPPTLIFFFLLLVIEAMEGKEGALLLIGSRKVSFFGALSKAVPIVNTGWTTLENKSIREYY